MARQVVTCGADEAAADAEARMAGAKVRRLPVVDDSGRLLGVLSLADVAREAERERASRERQVKDDEIGRTLAAICRPREAHAGTA